MIFNVTRKTIRKKIHRNTTSRKEYALYRVTTYWFLFIPVLRTEECL